MRRVGALTLLGVGLVHLEQFTVGHYSAIPTIGTLFALNAAAATLVAAGLAVRDRPLLRMGGVLIAAGSLLGLLAGERTTLFGFRETGYRPAVLLSIALEVATIALLAPSASAAARRDIRSRWASRSGAVSDGSPRQSPLGRRPFWSRRGAPP